MLPQPRRGGCVDRPMYTRRRHGRPRAPPAVAERTGAGPPALGGAADDDGARQRHRHRAVPGQRSVGERRRAGHHPVLRASSPAVSLLLGRALTEMAVAHPTAGAFGVYAAMYVSPFAGYAVRVSYWLMQVIATGGQLVACVDLHGLLVSRRARRGLGARLRGDAALPQLARGRPAGHDRVPGW